VAKSDHRIPVLSDSSEFNIPWLTLQTIIAGRSLIDTFELNIRNLDEAHKFLISYGLKNNEDAEKLRKTAFEYVETVLLDKTNLRLPENITDFTLPELMVEASADTKTRISEWSCLILKVCHAVAHAQWSKDEDAYNAALVKFNARLKPFIIDSRDGIWFGDDDCRIPIVEYKVKSRKRFFRVVTKLLLKQGNLSARIYDHIGVRFVTNDIFSAILLIKFLRSRHILMYANVLPQESKNLMADFEQIEKLFSEFSAPLQHTLKGVSMAVEPASKNPYSSKEFKMIKIVERVLVTTNDRNVFFPCEFQILTRQTHETLRKKRSNHSAYGKRQIEGVRNRLFNGTTLIRES
jgi:uncharacterized protein (TIGR04562 family)